MVAFSIGPFFGTPTVWASGTILSFFQVKKDPMTGESRGFGFVSFADNKVAETVLSRTHTILGRRCEVRLPRPKVGQKVIK